MWQAEADTELTLSASPATAEGPIGVNPGELALEYGNIKIKLECFKNHYS